MSQETAVQLVPAPGTVERRLLVEVLARMARVWLDMHHQVQNVTRLDGTDEPGTLVTSNARTRKENTKGGKL